MKLVSIALCLVLAFWFMVFSASGCIAKSSHVNEGDRIVADLAKSVAIHFPDDNLAQQTYISAANHALKDSSAIPFQTNDFMEIIIASIAAFMR